MGDGQENIIEIASPTDRDDAGFDGAGDIDLSLLESTLEYIRPALQADGGDLILVGAENGTVKVQLTGACNGCPLSEMTLTSGIERIVRDRVPGVKNVEAV